MFLSPAVALRDGNQQRGRGDLLGGLVWCVEVLSLVRQRRAAKIRMSGSGRGGLLRRGPGVPLSRGYAQMCRGAPPGC